MYGRATGMDQYCFIVSQFVDVFIVSWPILDWKFFGSGIVCSVLVWWLLGATKQHRQLPLIMCRNSNFSMFSWKKLSTSANIVLLIWEKRRAGFAASLFAAFSKGKKCLSDFTVVLSHPSPRQQSLVCRHCWLEAGGALQPLPPDSPRGEEGRSLLIYITSRGDNLIPKSSDFHLWNNK